MSELQHVCLLTRAFAHVLREGLTFLVVRLLKVGDDPFVGRQVTDFMDFVVSGISLLILVPFLGLFNVRHYLLLFQFLLEHLTK